MLTHELIEAGHEEFPVYWQELAVAALTLAPVKDSRAADPSDACENFGNALLVNCSREIDCSFVLVEDSEPLLGCQLGLSLLNNGKRRLGFRGNEATTFISSRALDSQTHQLGEVPLTKIAAHLNYLIKTLKPDVVELKDALDFGLLSPLSQLLIEKGGLPKVTHSTVIDLLKPNRALLRNVKKSVRCHLQGAQREYQCILAESAAVQLGSGVGQAPNHVEAGSSKLPTAGPSGAYAGKVFKTELTYHDQRLATATFSHHGRGLRLRQIGCVQSPANKQLLYSLLWWSGEKARANGWTSLILDHDLQNVNGELLNFSFLGGIDQSEISVTLHNP